MKKDFLIPQGKFKVGRDVPAGVYLIAATNKLTHVSIVATKNKYEYYSLSDEESKMCHVELENDDILTIHGSVIIRPITKFISEKNSFNLFSEIENFKKSIQSSKATKKKPKIIGKIKSIKDKINGEKENEDTDIEGEVKVEVSSKTKQKGGFWNALGALFSTVNSASSQTDTNTGLFASQKKKHAGKCDGDCANCPPHYGYRYGRWYYGHNHIEGCVFGGNNGSGGRD